MTGLRLLGFNAVIDRRDIAAGEEWEGRLASLIHAADTVLFVISPEAIRSERCGWEVAEAIAASKRLIPIMGKPSLTISCPQN